MDQGSQIKCCIEFKTCYLRYRSNYIYLDTNINAPCFYNLIYKSRYLK